MEEVDEDVEGDEATFAAKVKRAAMAPPPDSTASEGDAEGCSDLQRKEELERTDAFEREMHALISAEADKTAGLLLAGQARFKALWKQLDVEAARAHTTQCDQLTALAQSSLMNLEFIRNSTHLDPQLGECGCREMANDRDLEYITTIFKACEGVDALVPEDKNYCHGETEKFEDRVRAEKPQPSLWICCERHEYQLRNLPKATSKMLAMAGSGDGCTRFVNLVVNGRL